MAQSSGNESESPLGASTASLDAARLWELIQAGRGLVAELDVEHVIGELLDVARRVTGARYAALGILDERRTELERFITRGIDPMAHRAIGDLPRGRGILGVLIQDPQPLRLCRHRRATRSPMASRPGIRRCAASWACRSSIRNEAFGNLYLTDKERGRFRRGRRAGGRHPRGLGGDRGRKRPALRRDDCTRRRARARKPRPRGDHRPSPVRSGRDRPRPRAGPDRQARPGAGRRPHAWSCWLQDGDELAVAASAGRAAASRATTRVSRSPGSVSGEVARSGGGPSASATPAPRCACRSTAWACEASTRAARPARLSADAVSGRHRGLRPPRTPTAASRADDEELLKSFAASAATAVATAQQVADERLRQTHRRGRAGAPALGARAPRRDAAGARHPHRGPASARRSRQTQADSRKSVDAAVVQIQDEIHNLRALITQLRPAALDELGVKAGDRGPRGPHRGRRTRPSEAHVDLAYEAGPPSDASRARAGSRDLPARSGGAQQRGLPCRRDHRADRRHRGRRHRDRDVSDDGAGFDPAKPTEGFGLLGMRERVELAGGIAATSTSSTGAGHDRARDPSVRHRVTCPRRGGLRSTLRIRSGCPPRSAGLASPTCTIRPRAPPALCALSSATTDRWAHATPSATPRSERARVGTSASCTPTAANDRDLGRGAARGNPARGRRRAARHRLLAPTRFTEVLPTPSSRPVSGIVPTRSSSAAGAGATRVGAARERGPSGHP